MYVVIRLGFLALPYHIQTLIKSGAKMALPLPGPFRLQLINWALMDSTDCQHVTEGGVSEALLPVSLGHEMMKDD